MQEYQTESKELYSKKGQAAGAVGAIITLIVGVGVAVLVLIFVGALGGQTYNLVEPDILGIGNNSVTVESVTAVNGSTAQLLHHDLHTTSLTIYNTSAGTIPLGNFTVDYSLGTIGYDPTNASAPHLSNDTTYLANYSWGEMEVQDSVKAGIVAGFEALEQTGDYLPIIVLAVVIALVLMLVLSFTAFGGQSGGSGTAL